MDDLDALIDEGLELLEIEDYQAAAKIGRKIIGLRHTYGHEILARACWGLGKRKKALEVIDEGLKKGPSAWLLWQLRGNFSSDEKNYERAYESYETALRIPAADASSVHLNYAIALRRESRFEEALQHLDRVGGEETLHRAAGVRAECLEGLGKRDEAMAVLRAALTVPCDELEEAARLHAHLGELLWAAGERDTALNEAWAAIALHRGNESAQWLIREIENEWLAPAVLYRVQMHGRWHEPIDEDGTAEYWVSYTVVAADKDEAIRLATRFEPEPARASLTDFEVRKRHKYDKAPKGVYWASGRIFFSESA